MNEAVALGCRQVPVCILVYQDVCCLCRDVAFGYGVGSEVGAIVLGMLIMVVIRALKLPLAEGLPSG